MLKKNLIFLMFAGIIILAAVTVIHSNAQNPYFVSVKVEGTVYGYSSPFSPVGGVEICAYSTFNNLVFDCAVSDPNGVLFYCELPNGHGDHPCCKTKHPINLCGKLLSRPIFTPERTEDRYRHMERELSSTHRFQDSDQRA